MTILVTGGSGFIGRRLLGQLLERGEAVRVLDLVVRPELRDITTQGDVVDPVVVDAAMAGVETVIHLAAEHRDDVDPVEKYYRTNVEGMKVLTAALTKHDVRNLVFASSVAVYGFDTNDGVESTPFAPENHYGRSKAQAEDVVQSWLRENTSNRAKIIRPCVVFGPGNRGNVYNLIHQIVSRRFLMLGDGSNRKSVAYVDNVVDALLFLARLDESVVVNYADKPEMEMGRFVATIARRAGVRLPPLHLPKWLGLVAGTSLDVVARVSRRKFPLSRVRVVKFCANSIVNADRIRQLGFAPRVSVEAGLEETLRHDFG